MSFPVPALFLSFFARRRTLAAVGGFSFTYVLSSGSASRASNQGGPGAAVSAWLEPLALHRESMPGVYTGRGQALAAFGPDLGCCRLRSFLCGQDSIGLAHLSKLGCPVHCTASSGFDCRGKVVGIYIARAGQTSCTIGSAQPS